MPSRYSFTTLLNVVATCLLVAAIAALLVIAASTDGRPGQESGRVAQASATSKAPAIAALGVDRGPAVTSVPLAVLAVSRPTEEPPAAEDPTEGDVGLAGPQGPEGPAGPAGAAGLAGPGGSGRAAG